MNKKNHLELINNNPLGFDHNLIERKLWNVTIEDLYFDGDYWSTVQKTYSRHGRTFREARDEVMSKRPDAIFVKAALHPEWSEI